MSGIMKRVFTNLVMVAVVVILLTTMASCNVDTSSVVSQGERECDASDNNEDATNTQVVVVRGFDGRIPSFEDKINAWLDKAHDNGWEIVQIQYSTSYNPNLSSVMHCAMITYKISVNEGDTK